MGDYRPQSTVYRLQYGHRLRLQTTRAGAVFHAAAACAAGGHLFGLARAAHDGRNRAGLFDQLGRTAFRARGLLRTSNENLRSVLTLFAFKMK